MKTAIKFAIVLGIICLVMGSGVALVYATFKGRIAEREREQFQVLLREVLPVEAGEPEPLSDDVQDVYTVRDAEGRPLAYAARGTQQGYAGPIDVLVGVWARPGLPIRRVVVLSQMETPGLGANVSETRSTYNLWQKLGQMLGVAAAEEEGLYNLFLDQFEGVVFDEQSGAPDVRIDAITAATITSDAVKLAVRQAVGRIREKSDVSGN